MFGIIYHDQEPRPSFWKHPIKWWKWKQPLIGYVDFDDDIETDDDLTIVWGESDGIQRDGS